MEAQVNVEDILAILREEIGNKAQEIAILKATLAQKETSTTN